MNYIFNYNYIFDIFFGEIKGIILFIVFTVDKVPRKNRSSRQEVFFKKGVFRNFAKFTGKHQRQSLSLSYIPVADVLGKDVFMTLSKIHNQPIKC